MAFLAGGRRCSFDEALSEARLGVERLVLTPGGDEERLAADLVIDSIVGVSRSSLISLEKQPFVTPSFAVLCQPRRPLVETRNPCFMVRVGRAPCTFAWFQCSGDGGLTAPRGWVTHDRHGH